MNKLLLIGLISFISLFFSGCGELEMLELKGVKNFSIENLSKSGMDLEMDLEIYNPNGIKFKVKEYDLDIMINNIKIGKAKIDEKMVLPRKSTSNHHVNVSASFQNMLVGILPLMMSLKKGKDATIRIVGDVKVGAMMLNKKVDIEFQKDISLRK